MTFSASASFRRPPPIPLKAEGNKLGRSPTVTPRASSLNPFGRCFYAGCSFRWFLPPPPVASPGLRVLTFGALPLLGRLLLPHEVGHGVSFSLLLPQHLIQVVVIDVPRQGLLHFLHCIFHVLLLLPALCQAGKDTGCIS